MPNRLPNDQTLHRAGLPARLRGEKAAAHLVLGLAMTVTLAGCAHAGLRRSLEMGPLESTSVEHVQAKADAVFPVGTSYAAVRERLGANSGPVAPVVMMLTLRPWPFEPWAVWDDEQGALRAESEEERSWLWCWRRAFIDLTFEFDSEKRLRSVRVRRSDAAL